MGILYLCSRGLVAVLVYFLVSTYTAVLRDYPAWRAMACGAGAEAILRSKFYVTRIKKGADSFEDVVRGPLDALHFYQEFFLISIENKFTKQRIVRVSDIVKEWPSFLAMWAAFEANILAWPQGRRDVIDTRKAAKLLRERFAREAESSGGVIEATTEKKYRHELCYVVLSNLGEGALDSLFEQ
ncbi:MAG TPA: hypothetical protein VMD78_13185 [Candidatus Baltobacteraceae bacterium]|nr:hypothetical protein [Candidatus Baltobacteraceae bacterium]